MSEAHNALTSEFKAGVKAEIGRIRAAGAPKIGAVEGVTKSIEADKLNWMMWEAATRDAILLYDEENIYEKHVDALTWTDAKEAAAFYYLAARARMEAGDQYFFAADVLEGLEELEVEDV
jgi:hypothetical protein